MDRHTDSYDGLIVGVSANQVKAHMPYPIWHDGRMTNMRTLLAKNLQALMTYHGLDGTPEVARRVKAKGGRLDQKTVWRFLNEQQSATIDKLEDLAKAFDLSPWQLLIPSLDPRNPPYCVMTEAEQKFYAKLESLRVMESPPHPYRHEDSQSQ